ncbi:nucleotidyl transferase AbiEii/AbiGii toxin family protein [Patescibacteria group bacterium]|nr:nucleotidyl transferase AbiEii/AbiGii toxin family protein [Patescibacteria group bacterium]
MGKTILTPKQLEFLELAQSQSQLTKRFYLTGGTALSEFYLQHRLSEDIDLFTEKEEVNQGVVEAFLKKSARRLKIKKIKLSQFLGLFSYQLIYQDGEELKVDFNYYPFLRIDKGIKFKNLSVDSLEDIAANKVHTLFMKPRPRDYIDLFFLMTTQNYDLNHLILDAKAKFDWDIDRMNLANQFIRVKELEFKDLPRMLKPLDFKKMQEFFLKLAKSLEKEIFK